MRSDTTTGRHKCVRREDLRVMVDIDYRGNSPRQEPRPVTDAELAGMGLVALDAIDLNQVRAAATEKGWNDGLRAGVLVPFARRILAVLEGGTTQ